MRERYLPTYWYRGLIPALDALLMNQRDAAEEQRAIDEGMARVRARKSRGAWRWRKEEPMIVIELTPEEAAALDLYGNAQTYAAEAALLHSDCDLVALRRATRKVKSALAKSRGGPGLDAAPDYSTGADL